MSGDTAILGRCFWGISFLLNLPKAKVHTRARTLRGTFDFQMKFYNGKWGYLGEQLKE